MRIEDVEHEIVMGTRPGEHPTDLLYMCHTVTFAQMEGGDDFDPDLYRFRRPSRSPIRTGWRARLLYGAGLILCPIFEPVKHEKFADYSERMIKARLQYRGIAIDPSLQFDFAVGVRRALERGALKSLEMARENDLPRLLSRSGSELGGTFS